jgi:hypothetical protein
LPSYGERCRSSLTRLAKGYNCTCNSTFHDLRVAQRSCVQSLWRPRMESNERKLATTKTRQFASLEFALGITTRVAPCGHSEGGPTTRVDHPALQDWPRVVEAGNSGFTQTSSSQSCGSEERVKCNHTHKRTPTHLTFTTPKPSIRSCHLCCHGQHVHRCRLGRASSLANISTIRLGECAAPAQTHFSTAQLFQLPDSACVQQQWTARRCAGVGWVTGVVWSAFVAETLSIRAVMVPMGIASRRAVYVAVADKHSQCFMLYSLLRAILISATDKHHDPVHGPTLAHAEVRSPVHPHASLEHDPNGFKFFSMTKKHLRQLNVRERVCVCVCVCVCV